MRASRFRGTVADRRRVFALGAVGMVVGTIVGSNMLSAFASSARGCSALPLHVSLATRRARHRHEVLFAWRATSTRTSIRPANAPSRPVDRDISSYELFAFVTLDFKGGTISGGDVGANGIDGNTGGGGSGTPLAFSFVVIGAALMGLGRRRCARESH
jgi:hypothetical protein